MVNVSTVSVPVKWHCFRNSPEQYRLLSLDLYFGCLGLLGPGQPDSKYVVLAFGVYLGNIHIPGEVQIPVETAEEAFHVVVSLLLHLLHFTLYSGKIIDWHLSSLDE